MTLRGMFMISMGLASGCAVSALIIASTNTGYAAVLAGIGAVWALIGIAWAIAGVIK